MNNDQIRELLSQAVNSLNLQQPQQADPVLQKVLAAHPALPQALALLGVTRLLENRNAEAENLLKRALADNPDQPIVLFHLGGALRAQGKFAEAAAAYRRILDSRSRDPDAHLALGATLRELGALDDAKAVYRKLLEIDPDSIAAKCGLGAVLNASEQGVEAEPILISALRTASVPELVGELENELGLAFMQQRRYAEAVDHFERAVARSQQPLSVEKNLATAYEYLRDTDSATATYRRILAKDPLDLKTHLLLNELLHRRGDTDQFLKSYDEAAAKLPDSPVPLITKADHLMHLDRAADALALYRKALRISPQEPAAHIGLGRAQMALGQSDQAIAAFETGLRHNPDSVDIQTSFAYCLLANGDASKAGALAEKAVAMAPLNQPALAVLGLCHRAGGVQEEDFLNDFDRLIQVFDLDPPAGYREMLDFNRDLGAHIDGLHEGSRAFFSQTLRGGTRSFDEFFLHNHDLRNRLRHRISDAITRFVSEMPNEPRHPFWARRAKGFRYSGSWSSRMCDGGYHLNHIHSGWISSVYYVSVPDVAAATDQKQGWLKFGEPPHDIGLKDPVRRLVQPKPGRLVLFPSFLWHGTVPYHSPQARTTVAFDIMPH